MAEQGTKVAVDSLGCKLNQAETELFARQLTAAGCRLVSPEDQPDVYILNTCTVTHTADRKCRHLLRMARRRSPGARIIVTGCYAERAPAELELDGVDMVVGNRQKSGVIRRLQEAGYLTPAASAEGGADGRTRAMVKVQEGCANFCTYCIVPLVRGEEKSVPVEQVKAQVKQLAAEGYREVVLTGTRVGAYRHGGADLGALLQHILSETPVERLRLSSLQPQEISAGLLQLWRDPRLCPHFHLSLQSGSDSVLGRMRRRYSTDEYRRSVSLVREVVPDVAVTTDVIVGFPGETDEEFAESYDFCRRMQFARIHVFPYSPREGTGAATMPHRVDEGVKRQRTDRMLALAKEGEAHFRQQFRGRTMPVLWEGRTDSNLWSGLTGNYIRVYTRSGENLANRLVPVKLT